MARVNHKRVKQLLNEKRSRITDRQFFTSRILAGHFEDMAMAEGGRTAMRSFADCLPTNLGIAYTRIFLRARPTTTTSAGRNGTRSRPLTSCPKTL